MTLSLSLALSLSLSLSLCLSLSLSLSPPSSLSLSPLSLSEYRHSSRLHEMHNRRCQSGCSSTKKQRPTSCGRLKMRFLLEGGGVQDGRRGAGQAMRAETARETTRRTLNKVRLTVL